MKQYLRNEAILLRRQGYLFSEIANELGISKSTASLWTAGLDLTKEELDILHTRRAVLKAANIVRMSDANRSKRLERENQLQIKAKEVVADLDNSTNHKRLLAAVMFWCEGGKDISGSLQFINSDPLMIKTFLSLLREGFVIDESKFRALVHLHDYHEPAIQQAYWSEVINIPLKQFHKPYIKPHTGKNIHPGYPGCVSVRYLDNSLGKLLKMIYSEFAEST